MLDYTHLIPDEGAQAANLARVQPMPSKRIPTGEVDGATWRALRWVENGRLSEDVTIYAIGTHQRNGDRADPEIVMTHDRAGGIPVVKFSDGWLRLTGIDGDSKFRDDGKETKLALGATFDDEDADQIAQQQAALVAGAIAARHICWPDKPEDTQEARARTIDRIASKAAYAFQWKTCRRREGVTPQHDEDNPAMARRPLSTEYAGGLNLKIAARHVVEGAAKGLATLKPFLQEYEAKCRGETKYLGRNDVPFGCSGALKFTCYRTTFATTIKPYSQWTLLDGVISTASGWQHRSDADAMVQVLPPPPGQAADLPPPEDDENEAPPKRARNE